MFILYSSFVSCPHPHPRPPLQAKRIDDLEMLIVGHKQEEGRLRKINFELEKQREKAVLTASNWNAMYLESQEEVKAKNMEAVELQKKIDEVRSVILLFR